VKTYFSAAGLTAGIAAATVGKVTGGAEIPVPNFIYLMYFVTDCPPA
jgi:hypothetical protein